MSLAVALAGMALSSVLYGMPFPPSGYASVAWFALVPVLLVLRSCSRAAAAVVAVGFAAWGAYSTADALPHSIADYYDQPRALGIAFFFAMAATTTSSVMLGFAYCYRRLARRASVFAPFVVAAAWTGYELVRARLLGNPWAALGYTQVDQSLLAQVADLAGVYGIGFVVAAVNAALVEMIVARTDSEALRARRGAALVAVVVAAAFAYGGLRMGGAAPAADGESQSVLIVQGNVDLGSQWREEFYGEAFGTYRDMTYEGLRRGAASLVVWPETALTFFLDREPLYGAAIAEVLEPHGAELITGAPSVVERDEGAEYFNSALLVTPDGRIAGRYDKEQLLPFAEYFPVPALDFLRRDFGAVREFTPGRSVAPLEARSGRAGVVICNESLFADIVGRRVDAGADVLVNLTNDGWLSDERLSGVAFAMTRLRAIEQRRYIVRASTSGPSAVIDPYGRIAAATRLFARDTTTASFARRSDRTVYARVGDAFAVLCLFAAVVATVRARRAA